MPHPSQVFPATSSPKYTFVPRVKFLQDIIRSLLVPGRPICIEGPYKSGKTTGALDIVSKHFSNKVHVVCQKTTTYYDILIKVFTSLGFYYRKESPSSDEKFIYLQNEYFSTKQQLEILQTKNQLSLGPDTPFPINSFLLAKFLAYANYPLLIDDIHKLSPLDLLKISELMREWQTISIDEGCPKVIVISSNSTNESMANQIIKNVTDLSERMARVNFSLMDDKELEEIITKGEDILNVDFKNVKSDIINYSCGFPGTCQDLCYHICFAAEVSDTRDSKLVFSLKHLDDAYSALKDDFDSLIKEKFLHLQKVISSNYSNAMYISILSEIEKNYKTGVVRSSLIDTINDSLRVKKEKIDNCLKRMIDDDYGVLRYDKQDGCVYFQDPQHYIFYFLEKTVKDKTIMKRRLTEIIRSAIFDLPETDTTD